MTKFKEFLSSGFSEVNLFGTLGTAEGAATHGSSLRTKQRESSPVWLRKMLQISCLTLANTLWF